MKDILFSIVIVLAFTFTGCSVSNQKEQPKAKTEINEDSLRTSKFKEVGVKYSSLATVGYWVFNIPKDPKIPASTNIKYTAFLYKDMNTDEYYLMERDYVEKSLVIRSLFLKKNQNRYVMIFKDAPWLKYEFDKEGNCWETEEGLEAELGTGEINTELLD
nr:MAG TPA: protein of unknown function (DUF4969) [Caudoviricetes sp.]